MCMPDIPYGGTVKIRSLLHLGLFQRHDALFMDISLNQALGRLCGKLQCFVTAVHHGENMSTVKLILPGGQRLTAAITTEAALGLDIAPDDNVVAVVKSTSVMLAKHE